MAKNYDVALLFDFYGDLLTAKRRAFFEYYYNGDLSLSEIAENEGLTRQGVFDTLKKGERQLRAYEDKLGLVQRFRLVSEKADEIERLAEGLCAEGTDVSAAAREIREKAAELKQLG
ncbi:MAG: DNA-binding protein [Clostridia bacterium]|nr:DNA-binding protein [Clostridia bacterium]MBR5427907.1 DNA-binding protein [Clostridia bacterium]